MAKKVNGKKAKSFVEIEKLKATQRKGIIKIVGAVVLIIILILGKSYLEWYGIIPDEIITDGALMLVAFALAAFAGFAGTDITKSGRKITEICTKNGITKEDIKEYERS